MGLGPERSEGLCQFKIPRLPLTTIKEAGVKFQAAAPHECRRMTPLHIRQPRIPTQALVAAIAVDVL